VTDIKHENMKYIFLDIVKFTQRSVEAQHDIIKELNRIVKTSVDGSSIKKDSCIFLPTGDGICIALKGESPFDIHIRIALDVLQEIDKYNRSINNKMRKFDVRIGINENVDNIIEDINGSQNVAGAGINLAKRIMDNADGGQILVGGTVYEVLRARENYMDSFKGHNASGKHGIQFSVYQYIKEGHPGLNIAVPEIFLNKKTSYKLSKKSAYYFAHAIKNKSLLIEKTEGMATDFYVPVILLWFLAQDSCKISTAKDFDIATLKQPGKGKLSFEEQYEVISQMYFWVICELSEFIVYNHLEKYHMESFETTEDGLSCWYIINKSGQEKLKREHPNIWQEFELDKYKS